MNAEHFGHLLVDFGALLRLIAEENLAKLIEVVQDGQVELLVALRGERIAVRIFQLNVDKRHQLMHAHHKLAIVHVVLVISATAVRDPAANHAANDVHQPSELIF